MTAWIPAYVGIGSNLGDSQARVRTAFDALAAIADTKLVARSSLYRTRPFGPVQQGDFINAAAGLLSRLSARDLLTALRTIEDAQGRVRSERWGPRTLDLDLLVYGDRRICEDDLVVPHPGIAERGFVLAPLNEIAPTLEISGVGRVEELLQRLPDDGIADVVGA